MTKLNALFSSIITLLALSLTHAERSTLCDDGEPLDMACSASLPRSSTALTCGANGLVALQAGCYRCVDATTCLSLNLELSANEQGTSHRLSKADSNDISVLLQDPGDEKSTLRQAVAMTKAKAKRDSIKSSKASNWLFVAPVCLAVVSLGLAIRARIPSRRHGFKRLQDRNRRKSHSESQDDINPFCSADEDMAIETAGHFQGDISNSESEEAQFLHPAQLDEGKFTLAESAALERAVMLHINEFDEQKYDEDEDMTI